MTGSGWRWLWMGCALMLLLLGSASAQPRVELSAKPLFGGLSREEATIPLQITLENQGIGVQGALVVSLEGFRTNRRYVYPIELPSGSRKQILAYPYTSQYVSQAKVTYEVNFRVLKETTVPMIALFDDKELLVAVSDEIGGLGFLSRAKIPLPIERFPNSNWARGRGASTRDGTIVYQPAFTRPEEFPTRAAACVSANAIVLGPGAERLTESQMRSIRTWVMMGGTLIVPGGAGALYLQMPALQAILPVHTIRAEQVASLSGLDSFLLRPAPQGAAIISAGIAKPTAQVLARQGSAPLIAVQPYGLGSVLYLAFSPWDQPVRGYAHNALLWQEVLKSLPRMDPAQIQSMTYLSQSNDNWWQNDDSWRWGGGMPQRFSSKREFRVPGVGTVMFVLLAYFLLVVPINFFALKKLRAMDWAWVTVPAIALIFVLILYQVGSGIYKQGQATDTQASLVMMAGEREAYAFASTLFFFPRAGGYELRFDRAELVESGTQGGFSSEMQDASLETLEGDPILIPDFRVRNLSYQWMRYARAVDLPQTIDANLSLTADKQVKGKIINRLPFDLENVALSIEGRRFTLNRIGRGQTLPVNLSIEKGELIMHDSGRVEQGPVVAAAFADTARATFPYAILQATAEGPNLSPQLDISGEVNQNAQYHCFIYVKRP